MTSNWLSAVLGAFLLTTGAACAAGNTDRDPSSGSSHNTGGAGSGGEVGSGGGTGTGTGTGGEVGSGGGGGSPGHALPPLPLHTEGRWILDASGQRFKFAAVNWYGAEEMDHVPAGLEIAEIGVIAERIRAPASTPFGSRGRMKWSSRTRSSPTRWSAPTPRSRARRRSRCSTP